MSLGFIVVNKEDLESADVFNYIADNFNFKMVNDKILNKMASSYGVVVFKVASEKIKNYRDIYYAKFEDEQFNGFKKVDSYSDLKPLFDRILTLNMKNC